MYMRTRQFLATLTMTALALASFAFFCTQMGTGMVDMGDNMQSHEMMANCMGNSPSPSCFGQHMRSFFQSIPVSPANELVVLAFFAAVVSFVVSLADVQRDDALRLQSGIKERLKRRRRENEHLPLTLAFSRGIIHSKRYA
jgi:hypothetical protein